jgi:hypothetical protein
MALIAKKSQLIEVGPNTYSKVGYLFIVLNIAKKDKIAVSVRLYESKDKFKEQQDNNFPPFPQEKYLGEIDGSISDSDLFEKSHEFVKAKFEGFEIEDDKVSLA